MMELKLTLAAMTKWTAEIGIPILLIVLAMILIVNISNFLIRGYFKKFIKTNGDEELEKRTKTLKAIIKSVVSIFVIATGSLLVLNRLGVNIGAILAAAGVLGIAVGFGAQKFIEDIINGAVILMEDQIRVGDVVKIGDKGGLVEKVDLKMVVLRDLSGNVHYIRNSKIDIITNMTRDYSMYVFEIGVAYRENIMEVIEVIKQVGEEVRNAECVNDILEPIEVLGLDQFADSAIVIKARVKTKPKKQWEVARKFNLRLKEKFDELNIEIPFPHRTLYIGQDKDGSSPALNIKTNNND